MCLEYLSSFFPLAWYQILRFSTWICHAWQIHPAGNFTLLAGNVLELTHFPISCQLCGKLTSPPVMFKTRAEIQLVTNYFLREEFRVFTRCWNTSWGSCSRKVPSWTLSRAGTLSRSEHGADNPEVVGSTPIWSIHLRAGLDSCRSLPTPNVLWICEQKAQPVSHQANLTSNHPETSESLAKGRQRLSPLVGAGKLLVQAQISSLP